VGIDFYRKGGNVVIEACKSIKDKYKQNVELYIAGLDIKVMSKYQDNGIHFLEKLSYDRLSYYFNLCDIFCMPSRFEAYGITFIEALCYGLLCIGRDKFAMKEIIKDNYNGYLIQNDDSENLAKKIFRIVNFAEINENIFRYSFL